MVEVKSNTGVTVFGVIRWTGVPAGKTGEWAGVELVRHVHIHNAYILEGTDYYIIHF